MLVRLSYSIVVVVCLGVCVDCSGELVGWWKLDEGSGSTAHDSAGTNDGTVEGATWVDDPVRQWCLGFDGDGDYVEIPHAETLNLLSEGTVTAWVRLNGALRQAIVTKQPATDTGNYHFITGSTGTMLFGICNGTWSSKVQVSTLGQVIVDEWAFYAATFDSSTVCLYENGLSVDSKSNTITPLATDSPVIIGHWPYNTQWDCDGLIGDVRIYNQALDQSEIQAMYSATSAGLAAHPVPRNNAVGVVLEAVLTWTPGANVSAHDVYFGTDFDAVDIADTASTGIYCGRQGYDANSYVPAGGLEYGTTYYWRIDEVNDPEIRKGEVWNFTTEFASDPEVEPHLVAWWKLDEGSGDTAYDYAGHSDGTIDGAAWVNDPVRGWVLGFNGSENVTLDLSTANSFETLSNEATIAFWMYGYDDFYGSDLSNVPVHARVGGSSMIYIQHPHKSGMTYWYAPGAEWVRVALNEEEVEGLWSHWAFTKNAGTGEMKIYQDGAEVANATGKSTPIDGANISSARIGMHCAGTMGFHGMLSDVRVYDIELSEADIERVMRGEGPGPHLTAHEPSPANREVDVSPDTTVSWTPGDSAQQHDVYFGTDFNDVNDADTSSAGIYQGRQDYDANGYSPPEALEFNQVYYWRIDEVNEPNVWPGEVWTFTTAGYIVVDDIESYDDYDNRIYGTWLDYFTNNSGATVGYLEPDFDAGEHFAETTIVHGGDQSMPLFYDNDGTVNEGTAYETTGTHHYSEAEQTFDTPQDWTQYDVNALVLYFYGSADNDVNEQMYVKLEDGDSPSHSKKVVYDGDPNDLRQESWHEWNIDLEDFGGVNLTNVRKITIGFGDGIAPTGSGAGVVYFDDIRLYPTRCVPKYGPQGDITDDCTVDFTDFLVLAGDWLQTDHSLEAVQPDPVSLVGWWKLDEGTGRLAIDSAGISYGNIYGAQWVNDSERGWVLDFDATETSLDPDYVDIDLVAANPFSTVSDEVTVALWQRGNNWGEKNVVFDARVAENVEIYCQVPSRTQVFWYAPGPEYIYKTADKTELMYDWSHWAFAKNAATGEMHIYRNGLLWHKGEGKTTPINGSEIDTCRIGASRPSTGSPFYFGGVISDVRVFNRALSQAEVGSVMGVSELYFPITSRANVYDQEPMKSKSINFNDLTVLAEDWLETWFWPFQE